MRVGLPIAGNINPISNGAGHEATRRPVRRLIRHPRPIAPGTT